MCLTRPVHQLPAENLAGWWNKLSLFRDDITDVGSHMLYFDLGVLITGSIDPLLFYDSDFAIIDNPYTPSFNSSIMRFKTGARPDIWTDFSEKIAKRLPGDQDWLAIKVPDADLWPEGWCVLFRLHATQSVPQAARAVCFSWRPNPDDYPAGWIKDFWH